MTETTIVAMIGGMTSTTMTGSEGRVTTMNVCSCGNET